MATKISQVVNTSGKRKRAVARATLRPGTGKLRINKVLLANIEPYLYKLRIQEPLALAGEVAGSVDINVSSRGGGASAQIEAARLAIAKALVAHLEIQTKSSLAGTSRLMSASDLRKIYLDYDRHLLVADTRYKEACKPNRSKARAKKQKSYR